MKKNITILAIFIGIFQMGFAQISYYKSISAELSEPYCMMISPDNRFCYVGTNNNFQVYERDETTGELTLISSITETNDGTEIYWGYSMVISADFDFLYLGFREYICVFEVNTATGLLTPTQTIQKWEAPSYINNTNNNMVLSEDDQFLYNSVNGDVFLYGRDTITGQLNIIAEYDDINSYQGSYTHTSCALSPDNRFLYATGGNCIIVFNRDSVSGTLSVFQELRGTNFQNQPLISARESRVSFDNRFLYTITHSMGSGSAVVLAVDPVTDSISIIQSHTFSYYPYDLTDPNSMTLSPNHKAFVVNSENEAAFFEIDTVSGKIELVNTFFSRSDFDKNMGGRKVYDAGNQYLYANPVFEDSIYIYRSNVFFNDHPSFCEGGFIELYPFAGYQSYLWSTGSTEPSIIVTDSGQFVLQVVDQYNNQYIDTVFVSVNPLPVVDLGNDTTLLVGESILLTPGYGYVQYLWNIDDWTLPYYIFTNDSTITADSIQISVMVTDDNGCLNSDTILIRLGSIMGVPETQNNVFSFHIFPNPTSSMISVCSSLGDDETIQTEIYSIQGAMLLNETIKNNSKINVSSLTGGMYLLKLRYSGGSFTTRLIIH